MIGFLIKKNFYDLWDNLFKVFILNIGFVISLAIPVYVPSIFTSVPGLAMAILLIGILWCFVYLAAAAMSLKAVSDYGNFTAADFFRNLKTSWPSGVVLGCFVFFGYILCTVVIPFYLSIESMIGLLLAALIFWTLATAALALQFFFAVRCRLDTKLIKAVKKCFIILLDNPMFCVFTAFHNLFILVFSLLAVFLFPGPAGILLFLDEALRLRLLKYDWIEANPEADRRKIPWGAILLEEREKTGNRSFKNFIFPWKE